MKHTSKTILLVGLAATALHVPVVHGEVKYPITYVKESIRSERLDPMNPDRINAPPVDPSIDPMVIPNPVINPDPAIERNPVINPDPTIRPEVDPISPADPMPMEDNPELPGVDIIPEAFPDKNILFPDYQEYLPQTETDKNLLPENPYLNPETRPGRSPRSMPGVLDVPDENIDLENETPDETIDNEKRPTVEVEINDHSIENQPAGGGGGLGPFGGEEIKPRDPFAATEKSEEMIRFEAAMEKARQEQASRKALREEEARLAEIRAREAQLLETEINRLANEERMNNVTFILEIEDTPLAAPVLRSAPESNVLTSVPENKVLDATPENTPESNVLDSGKINPRTGVAPNNFSLPILSSLFGFLMLAIDKFRK